MDFLYDSANWGSTAISPYVFGLFRFHFLCDHLMSTIKNHNVCPPRIRAVMELVLLSSRIFRYSGGRFRSMEKNRPILHVVPKKGFLGFSGGKFLTMKGK